VLPHGEDAAGQLGQVHRGGTQPPLGGAQPQAGELAGTGPAQQDAPGEPARPLDQGDVWLGPGRRGRLELAGRQGVVGQQPVEDP
jgi:hypothetical protein